jgi:tetratricopeptide (TPR) repeat protein
MVVNQILYITDMIKFICFTFLLSLSYISSAQTNNSLYSNLEKAIENENYKKAEIILEKLATLEGENFFHSLKLANYYGKINQLDSTAIYIEKAISQYKYLPISQQRDDFKLTRDSLYKSSILLYDKIISLKPTNWHYCNRGVLKSDIGWYKESIIDFSKAIEIDSMNYINFYNRGLAYRKLNLLDAAVMDYTKSIELNPDYASAYLNKGYTLMSKNEYSKAIEEFKIALSKPISLKEKGYVTNNIGFAYYKLEDYELAKKFIKKSLEIYPINAFAYKNLALIDIALKNMDNACENIQKSIDLGFVNQFGNEIIDLQKENCK